MRHVSVTTRAAIQRTYKFLTHILQMFCLCELFLTNIMYSHNAVFFCNILKTSHLPFPTNELVSHPVKACNPGKASG